MTAVKFSRVGSKGELRAKGNGLKTKAGRKEELIQWVK
jgi:hypothetical protein